MKATSRYADGRAVSAGDVCVIMMAFVIVARMDMMPRIVSHVPMSSAPEGEGRRVFWHIFQPSTLISMKSFTNANAGARGKAETKSVA